MPPENLHKGMRKGTKSCLECRKRKVKCIFSNGDAVTCIPCKAKGKMCVEQRKVFTTPAAPRTRHAATALEDRVAQLEALLVTSRSAALPSPQTVVSTQGSPELDSTEEPGLRNPTDTLDYQRMVNGHSNVSRMTDTVESIFNNALLKQKDSERRLETHISDDSDFNSAGDRDQEVCDELCKDLPSPRLLGAILNATSSWWDTWRHVGSWLQETMSQNNVRTLQEFVSWTLASSEPAMTALGILSITVSIQQLSSTTHSGLVRQLPHPPGQLFHEYFERVNRLIINRNGYSTSRAGIEVIMVSAQIFMNLGLLKMTWLLHHRGISHAQLLGLHRPHRLSPTETASQMANRQETWFMMCQYDLYTSVLLGLPSATHGRLLSPSVYGTSGTVKFFFYSLMQLSARIIDRNQMGNGTSVSDTQDIEKDVAKAAGELPPNFWNAPASFQDGHVDQSEYRERLASMFWFFQLKVLLHQPLMIQSIEDNRLLRNRSECLSACRETLKIYHLMRSDTSAFGMLRVIDYQAFVCSAILLLGLLGYGMVDQVPGAEANDDYEDYEILRSTTDLLRLAATNPNNSIAAQAVQGLDTLAGLVKAGRTGDCVNSEGRQQQCSAYAKITIPGSGTINITPGQLLKNNMSKSRNSAGYAPPLSFHLSHSSSQDLGFQELPPTIQYTDADPWLSPNDNANYNIHTMDLDWTNMMNMDLGDDWAWLADVNAGML